MTDLVERIRNLGMAGVNDVVEQEINTIVDDVQKLEDELNDLHNWKEDYRNQIKELECQLSNTSNL